MIMEIKEKFVESDLFTKFAKFRMRVYDLGAGMESFALYTEPLDVLSPPIVRVHSECITGDALGSLHCDCGAQLNKALHLISEQGGILIYLRQEGRGIGLFEKMKAYRLQAQGYDTFEANVALGHQPDQRSYEMARTILDDLGVTQIRLLTNNPLKVSEIARLGIKVVERIPLISKATKHNKAYLKTKSRKFQHFLSKPTQHYLCQFNLNSTAFLTEIMDFVKRKKKDPLLKVGVALSANHDSLIKEDEISKIRQIMEFFENQPDFIPILHFSFKKSLSPLRDAEEAKKLFPSINRIQVNDLQKTNLSLLKKLSLMFKLDIPLDDQTFDLVHNPRFRRLIQKENCFIVLDSSKGKGIQASEESFIRKITVLLSYGITNITLCGGFGPDSLEIFHKIKKYFKVNFSIDAETRVKTSGVSDLTKITTYLSQLFFPHEPNQEGIDQTRKFLKSFRREGWSTVSFGGYEFAVHPKVFHPGYFPSSSWFADEVASMVQKDSTFCEIGCGSGIVSCFVALKNEKLRVMSTDINVFAKENTSLNAEKLGISSRIQAMSGDVFDGIPKEARFDSIFWALPFGFLAAGDKVDLEEAQVFDPGYRAIRKFLTESKKHLNPGGRLLIGFSSDLGNIQLLKDIAEDVSLSLVKVKEAVIKEDKNVSMEIIEGKFSVF